MRDGVRERCRVGSVLMSTPSQQEETLSHSSIPPDSETLPDSQQEENLSTPSQRLLFQIYILDFEAAIRDSWLKSCFNLGWSKEETRQA